MQRFKSINTLVTGAASGIGRATALRIAKEGGNLALIDINAERLSQLAQELVDFNVKVVYAVCDVANFEQTGSIISELCQRLGCIQALSHNAGILRCYRTEQMTLAQWNEIISINLTGTFNVNRHAIPYLLKNKSSSLVNTASCAAEQPHPWMAAYAASKGGIISFTRSVFVEYALNGLRANCVLPGGIESDLSSSFKIPVGANPELIKTLVPLGKTKFTSPNSVSSVIALLLSEDGFHINGTEISVDGGKLFN